MTKTSQNTSVFSQTLHGYQPSRLVRSTSITDPIPENSVTDEANFQSPRIAYPAPSSTVHSYGTISKLRTSMKKISPRSPVTPSPAGAGELKVLLGRLEEIDLESRELLKGVFSLLEKDARLEKYVRKRLEDTKVSRIWQLIEQILECQDGHIDLDELLNDGGSGGGVNKGIMENEIEDEMSTTLERFKIRTLDAGDGVGEAETTNTTSTE